MQTILKTALCAALTLLVTAGNGEAQTGRLPGPKLAPGQVVEMVAPALTVLSTTHYQAMLALSCGNDFCSGDFPKPGSHRQLNITRMSCVMNSTNGSIFSDGSIGLQTAAGVPLLAQFLSVDFDSSNGVHTINRAVDMQVAASQHIYAFLGLTSGTPSVAICTATGTLSVLK